MTESFSPSDPKRRRLSHVTGAPLRDAYPNGLQFKIVPPDEVAAIRRRQSEFDAYRAYIDDDQELHDAMMIELRLARLESIEGITRFDGLTDDFFGTEQ